MVKKLLSYFNKELNFYETLKVVENQADSDIIGSCKRYLSMCPIKDAYSCMGKSIFLIGEFDDENIANPVLSYKDPVLVVDCDSILKARFPAIYEQGREVINPEDGDN